MFNILFKKKEFKIDRYLDLFDQKKKELEKASIKEQKEIIKDMPQIASNIPSLKGWPYDSEKFWDNDAFIWQSRVEEKVKAFLRDYLSKYSGVHLSIGSGSDSYVNNAMCLDMSFEMLVNNNSKSKVQADAEQGLPFKDNSFDSCSMIFVANYIKNIGFLIKEIKRVLKKNGKLVIIQSVKPVDTYHIFVEKHSVDEIFDTLIKILKDNNFSVKVQNKNISKKTLRIINAVKY